MHRDYRDCGAASRTAAHQLGEFFVVIVSSYRDDPAISMQLRGHVGLIGGVAYYRPIS